MLPGTVLAQSDTRAAEPGTALADENLRERLTQRRAKLRTPNPWRTEIGGGVLFLSGELGLDLEQSSQPRAGTDERRRSSESTLGLEAEAYYSIGDSLALFAQLRAQKERQRRSTGARQGWRQHIERGEMWLHSWDTGASGLNVELGRLKFEDERRWWWDEELDAVRVSHDSEAVEFSLALARELSRSRSDRSGIDADQNGVRRWLAHAKWDWQPDQAISLFLLRHDDRSSTQQVGQAVRSIAQDASDARLTWTGARIDGELKLRSAGRLFYSLDLAHVSGVERSVEYEANTPPAAGQSTVTGVGKSRIRGSAVDAGLRWQLPLAGQPRLSVGRAMTFAGAANGVSNGFRQTGLHQNQNDFGGAKDFARYGVALDPELSNLRITTVGLGFSLAPDTSVDLVHHAYRQSRSDTELRDGRFAAKLTGLNSGIGGALDLVLTALVSHTIEVSATVSTFRAGPAFGLLAGRRHYFSALVTRFAF